MTLFIALLIPLSLFAAPWVLGNSGAPGTESCASSCHGNGSGDVEIFGFPESYYPDSTYLVRLTSSETTIKNFNSSCRVGTSSLNAGVLLGQGMTAGYSVPGETNGVHATVLDQDTLFFRWRAPISGTGEVRLYVAAHQGHDTGPNNDLMMVATEIIVPQPPDTPSHPFPDDSATNVSDNTLLQWDEVERADSFRVFFGTETPPILVATQTQISYSPGELDNNTRYYWRVEAFNEVGTTSGPEWEFLTEVSSGSSGPWVGDYMLYPPYPNPFNSATTFRMELIGNVPLLINIYDVQGRFVETLFDGVSRHGQNVFTWNAKGAAGIYFARANIDRTQFVYKLLYLR